MLFSALSTDAHKIIVAGPGQHQRPSLPNS
jgi:hypothetical protein